ncbi:hypothetical protein [Plantactinospora sonchi]|uniref:Uncharacterized protein n=1 Tax=Plantactinospora sonchi TaxID=1544735 RepID=A0ABU7S369_9ACTN
MSQLVRDTTTSAMRRIAVIRTTHAVAGRPATACRRTSGPATAPALGGWR